MGTVIANTVLVNWFYWIISIAMSSSNVYIIFDKQRKHEPPLPTCHWGTRSFASQRSLAFSSPPGHKLHRPGKNQVDQFEAGMMWPYGRQLNVTFWMKDLVLSYPDKISPSIQKKMYKVLPRLQNQPGLKGHWQTCPNPQKPFQRREEAPPRLRQLHIFCVCPISWSLSPPYCWTAVSL